MTRPLERIVPGEYDAYRNVVRFRPGHPFRDGTQVIVLTHENYVQALLDLERDRGALRAPVAVEASGKGPGFGYTLFYDDT